MGGLEYEEMGDDLPEFTLAEIIEMQNLFKKKGEDSLSQKFCQETATRFSCSIHRTGKTAIKWEQVKSWFQDKQKKSAAKIKLSFALNEFVVPSYAKTTNTATASSSPVFLRDLVLSDAPITSNATRISQKPKGERVAGLSELVFEAKSSKDLAWYDVAAFLSYRVLCTGELEVRVRFAGFGNVEDEWVNLKRGVRERSIPVEPSECYKLKIGDLVLCFRENDDHALYGDAQIVGIQRGIHDIEGCNCVYVVRYAYDNAEVKVALGSICRRPT